MTDKQQTTSPAAVVTEVVTRAHNEGIQAILEKGKPQLQTLVTHLLGENGHISQYEAMLLYRIAALPKRITELEEAGIRIERRYHRDSTGRNYVRYKFPQGLGS